MFWNTKIRITQQTYDNFITILRFCRFCGFFPLSVKRDGPNLYLKWSPFYAVYSFVLGIFLCFRANWELMKTYVLQKSHDIIQSPADKVTMIFAHDGWVFFYFFGVFFMSNKFLTLFNYMELLKQIDEVVKTTYKKSERRSAVLAMVVTSLLALIYCSNNLRYLLSTGATFLMFLDQTGAYYGLYILCMPAFFIIGCLIWTLEKRFERLNHLLELENLNVLNKSRLVQKEHAWRAHGEYHGINVVKTRSGADYQHDDHTIAQLASIYLKLCDAAALQNQIFGEIIVIGVVMGFVQIVQPLYFLIVAALAKGIVIQSLIGTCISVVRNTFAALLIVESAYSCNEQANVTQKLVCRLFCNKVSPKYRFQIRIFCICLGLRRIVYTAADIFTVDRFLVTSMTASAVTFMLLLLQMEGANK